MAWGSIIQKFNQLTHSYAETPLRKALIYAVDQLESIQVKELTKLLAQIKIPEGGNSHHG